MALSAPARAVPAEFIVSIEIKIGLLQKIGIVRGATAEISLVEGGRVAMRFPDGAFSGGVTVPLTDPASFPINGVGVSLSSGLGTLLETDAGGLAGQLPLAGTYTVCLFAACNDNPPANIVVPLTEAGTRGVGVDGAPVVIGGLVAVTLLGAPWSTGEITIPLPGGGVFAPSGFAHGPVSGGASSAAAPGGRIRMVTPIVVQTNIGASSLMNSFATLDLFAGPNGDEDEDGLLDVYDNCPTVPNVDQRDLDGSGIGDACNEEFDPDGDEIENWKDNCDLVSNVDQRDSDASGIGNACNDAIDADGDEREDDRDNCPTVANPDQQDRDFDRIGDACNDATDFDGDEITDDRDNCYALPNPLQQDLDADLLGDPCDPFPNEVNDATRALRIELAQTSGALAQRTAQRDAAVASVALLATEVAEKEELVVDLGAENATLQSALAEATAEKLVLEEQVAALARKLGSPPCRADLNDDSVVNFADLAAFKATFLGRCEP